MKNKKDAAQEEKDALLKVIGQQKVVGFFKESLGVKTLRQKRELVDRSNISISLHRQCDLLGIHKSGIYYKPKAASELNLELMRLIDEHYLEHPSEHRGCTHGFSFYSCASSRFALFWPFPPLGLGLSRLLGLIFGFLGNFFSVRTSAFN